MTDAELNLVQLKELKRQLGGENRFIGEKICQNAIDCISNLVEPPVILKIVGMIDEELKELSTPKSPFAQPFKEGRIMALQQLRKEIDNNFSA